MSGRGLPLSHAHAHTHTCTLRCRFGVAYAPPKTPAHARRRFALRNNSYCDGTCARACVLRLRLRLPTAQLVDPERQLAIGVCRAQTAVSAGASA